MFNKVFENSWIPCSNCFCHKFNQFFTDPCLQLNLVWYKFVQVLHNPADKYTNQQTNKQTNKWPWEKRNLFGRGH